MGCLARDYLAFSASSATVERTFLAAADICATGRSAMAIQTIEQAVSSHMWLRNGVKLGGKFSDCQVVIEAAEKNPKCAKKKNGTTKA
jgi:hypothetical protein